MARVSQKKKAQTVLLEEIKKQLILQSERWGRKDYYTPLMLEEIEQEQCQKIAGELQTEKTNLEYELHLLESDKKEILMKIERLELYLKRADKVIKNHNQNISKMIQKKIGNQLEIQKAVNGLNKKSYVSLLISDN